MEINCLVRTRAIWISQSECAKRLFPTTLYDPVVVVAIIIVIKLLLSPWSQWCTTWICCCLGQSKIRIMASKTVHANKVGIKTNKWHTAIHCIGDDFTREWSRRKKNERKEKKYGETRIKRRLMRKEQNTNKIQMLSQQQRHENPRRKGEKKTAKEREQKTRRNGMRIHRKRAVWVCAYCVCVFTQELAPKSNTYL